MKIETLATVDFLTSIFEAQNIAFTVEEGESEIYFKGENDYLAVYHTEFDMLRVNYRRINGYENDEVEPIFNIDAFESSFRGNTYIIDNFSTL